MEVHLLRLASLSLGGLAVLAALVTLIVRDARRLRWSLVAFGLATADLAVYLAAVRAAPPSLVTRLAALAAMLAFAMPAARWAIAALQDVSE